MASKRFLIVGRSGMGKSSLINTTFGSYIAETAEFEACTRLVTHHAHGTPWGDLELIDTPGFAEGGYAEDERVVSLIAKGANVNEADAVLLVTRLDETRMRPDEARMIELLTGAFGESFWLKAWLMLTFAASVPASERDERSHARQMDLIDAVQEAVLRRDRGCAFTGFERSWLLDNVQRGWSASLMPLGRALSMAA